ncbi:hypothetical protein [Kangiella shandongensis]|uniref:hypothetical protein n=1 Tax=Kangiella shandongensis TaxID=2763258 RepID=UPI001CBF1306|nr:hypothetical protein [Kangiella shandongensis]
MRKMTGAWSQSILIAVLSALSLAASAAEDEFDAWGDEWTEEEQSNWLWGGFIEAAYGQRLQTDPLFADKQTLSEIRSHVEGDYSGDDIDFSFRGDLWYDDVLNDTELDIRELSISFSAFGNTDFKLGRQISTWGTGDLLFLNDLFPKDWKSFFSGREDTYLKAPADAVRITSYFDAVNVDLVWMPVFTDDRYIDGERYSFFTPLAGQHVGGRDLIEPVMPDKNIGNSEIALRLYKNIEGTEYAVYGYRGFDKQPVGLTTNFEPTFHRRDVLGASVRGNVADGLYNLEVAYHDAIEDPDGADPLVKNSQWRFLMGYETELMARMTLGVQYYLEWTQDYDALLANSPTPLFEAEEKRSVVTARLTYRTVKDKWIWSLFAFYSPTDEDSYIRPSVNYRLSDEWQFTAGANIFNGQKRHTFFGQFEDATNAYLRVRYNF